MIPARQLPMPPAPRLVAPARPNEQAALVWINDFSPRMTNWIDQMAQVQSASGDITRLQAEIDALKARDTALEADVGVIQHQILVIQQQILALQIQVNGIWNKQLPWEPLVGARNGVNTNFTIASGTVRLGTNGRPQASLLQGGAPIPYTATNPPGPYQWTMVGQTFILGTVPTGSQADEPILAFVVVQ